MTDTPWIDPNEKLPDEDCEVEILIERQQHKTRQYIVKANYSTVREEFLYNNFRFAKSKNFAEILLSYYGFDWVVKEKRTLLQWRTLGLQELVEKV